MIECINCSHLGDCTETDVQKLLSHYRCDRWEEVPQEKLKARIDSVNRYGVAAAQALITMEEED